MLITDQISTDESAEPGLTLDDPPPRTLGSFDLVALWGNLGVSLLGPTAALFVLAPIGTPMSLLAAFVAVVIGTLIGTLPVALSALAGAQTGHPAMVLLRGLFGARVSYLPTVLNLLQCLGWGVFELVVISSAAEELLPWKVRWPYVVARRRADHAHGAAATGRRAHAAPLRAGGRRGVEHLLPRRVPAPPAARHHPRLVVRVLAGRRRGDRRVDLLGAAGCRLHPARPLRKGGVRRFATPATR